MLTCELVVRVCAYEHIHACAHTSCVCLHECSKLCSPYLQRSELQIKSRNAMNQSDTFYQHQSTYLGPTCLLIAIDLKS